MELIAKLGLMNMAQLDRQSIGVRENEDYYTPYLPLTSKTQWRKCSSFLCSNHGTHCEFGGVRGVRCVKHKRYNDTEFYESNVLDSLNRDIVVSPQYGMQIRQKGSANELVCVAQAMTVLQQQSMMDKLLVENIKQNERNHEQNERNDQKILGLITAINTGNSISANLSTKYDKLQEEIKEADTKHKEEREKLKKEQEDLRVEMNKKSEEQKEQYEQHQKEKEELRVEHGKILDELGQEQEQYELEQKEHQQRLLAQQQKMMTMQHKNEMAEFEKRIATLSQKEGKQGPRGIRGAAGNLTSFAFKMTQEDKGWWPWAPMKPFKVHFYLENEDGHIIEAVNTEQFAGNEEGEARAVAFYNANKKPEKPEIDSYEDWINNNYYQ
jgi:hypothetical protein